MSWKKAKLFEHLGSTIFLSEYGLCKIKLVDMFINDKPSNQVYIRYGNNKEYSQLLPHNQDFMEVINNIFNGDLATRKTSNNYYSYYGASSVNSADVNPFKLKSIKLTLKIEYCTSLESRPMQATQQVAQKVIEIEKESDVEKYVCWFSKEENIHSLQAVNLSEVNKGDKLYLVGVGEVMVEELFSYPNEKGNILTVRDLNDTTRKVCFNERSRLYYLPYQHKKDLIDEIDDANNEQLLLPFVEMSATMPAVYNVYWNPVKEASRYVVSVYKSLNINAINKSQCYHLADYDVDRNTHYLALNNLVGNGFIFKVVAEDRSGKVIAKSQGIVKGYPQKLRN